MRSACRPLFLLAAVVALAVTGAGSAFGSIAPAPATPAIVAISPSDGTAVGIYPPVTVRYAAPVTDRAAAERALTVLAPEAVPGHVTWRGATEMTWLPESYLPARTRVQVFAAGWRTEFETNAGFSAEGDISAHTFTVSIGGVPVRTMPASYGKPGWETPAGTFPILEKFRRVTFDSRTIGIPLSSAEGYLIQGEYAERLTWGGVFVHSAPWSVESQGSANVSHGCVNLAPDDAAWFYENAGIGDPVQLHW
ncbi:L,D-transpeptidase [Nocardia asteroides]|uniref:L,D-transpeptidase n=1 Tax=Nocardia asteroides TaxID=1824 RepID=UPI001E2E2C56|nr:L,D-transpeptidase [Nocardia asteroides]UGT63119.1 L,D-transpeptidase [Nocardia asteroides]